MSWSRLTTTACGSGSGVAFGVRSMTPSCFRLSYVLVSVMCLAIFSSKDVYLYLGTSIRMLQVENPRQNPGHTLLELEEF